MPTRLIASSVALIAFVIALSMGIAAGNTATYNLVNALGALFICYLLGLVVALVAQRAIDEHIAEYQRTHPLPEESTNPSDVAPESAAQTHSPDVGDEAGADHPAPRAA